MFNVKRQAPGKKNNKSTLIRKGDKVRVYKKGKKQDKMEFKAYRGKHFTEVQTVTAKTGGSYTVGGKRYTRDRLLKIEGTDEKSRELLRSRNKKPERKKRPSSIKEIKAKARIAPRRSTRNRTKVV